MVQAPGIRVPLADAEAQRRALAADGTLRNDLQVIREDGHLVLPLTSGDDLFEFEARAHRPRHYSELLADAADAPRAFDTLGDILLVKVPDAWWPRRKELGEAMRAFHNARAVFHDGGVKGPFRVRDLTLIAGEGGSETEVQEHGVRLRVDPAKAYYSPRLASERGRVAKLVQPGERALDMFGGVAPQGVQLAKAGAQVTSVDLNPEATRLALENARLNKVDMEVLCQDARALELPPFDRINMNLPHGAKHFLDEAIRLANPGASIHYHEILPDDDKDDRAADVAARLGAKLVNERHVRAYSAVDSHWVFDLRMP